LEVSSTRQVNAASRTSKFGVLVAEEEFYGGREIQLASWEWMSALKSDRGVEIYCPDQPMANVELVVVLEVKASVRVAKLRSVCWTSHNEVWPGEVKVFRRETLIPEEETGELCMRTGPSLSRRGA